jgi:hypothetical protein
MARAEQTVYSLMAESAGEAVLGWDGAPRRGRVLRGAVSRLRAHPVANPLALAEWWREARGGHAVEEADGPHLQAALEWLARAQDVTTHGGVARGYSLAWHGEFRSRGWQPPYPVATGYLIPSLYIAARHLGTPALADRATRAAQWELDIQLPEAGVRGGVSAAAWFNIGQIMFGWLSARDETSEECYGEAARRAGRLLVSMVDGDGYWPPGPSPLTRAASTMYNVRTAWALARAGRLLDEPGFVHVAQRNLQFVLRRIHSDGWLPDSCPNDPVHPLLHFQGYAIRALVEGGTELGHERAVEVGAIAAERLAALVRDDGWMAGRHAARWRPAASWSCLSGQLQMTYTWLELYRLTGQAKWLEPVPRVLRFVKATQNRAARDPGLRGGIRGSAPIGGEYCPYEILTWATKFFVDALIRREQVSAGAAAPPIHAIG